MTCPTVEMTATQAASIWLRRPSASVRFVFRGHSTSRGGRRRTRSEGRGWRPRSSHRPWPPRPRTAGECRPHSPLRWARRSGSASPRTTSPARRQASVGGRRRGRDRTAEDRTWGRRSGVDIEGSLWRGWPLERRGSRGVEVDDTPLGQFRVARPEQPCAGSSMRRRSSRRHLRAADAHASPHRVIRPGARGPVWDDPAVGADDRSAFPMANDAAQRRRTTRFHRWVWLLGVSRRGMPSIWRSDHRISRCAGHRRDRAQRDGPPCRVRATRP